MRGLLTLVLVFLGIMVTGAMVVYAASTPVAQCKDVTVPTDPGLAEASFVSVDDGSFDPDGDPIILDQTPGGPYQFGQTPVSLRVTDSTGLSDICGALVTVVDEEPPVVTAALVPVGEVDDDEGKFRVEFSCSDAVDPDPTITSATLNGIPVQNGQVVELEVEDDEEQQVEEDDGVLEIEAPSFELVVTCEDASGNVGAANATPPFAQDDDDDDDKDDDDKDDDDKDDDDKDDG